jgi:triosephosphate isomerase
MNRRYRKTVIAGNWKMNKTPGEVKPFVESLKKIVGRDKNSTIVLCVPFICVSEAVRATRDTRFAVGAQNVHQEDSGAYTGEVSADMLAAAGVKYVIIGHSERRQYFGETDALVNAKTKKALDAGLKPIICVGETLAQRESGITMEVVRLQVKAALAGIAPAKLKSILFAYEPVWAIGTGRTATAEQADEAGSEIRAVLRGLYGARAARAVTIQYGGSMNPKNAAELLSQPDVDGGLIGGASLKPDDFAAIILAANQ